MSSKSNLNVTIPVDSRIHLIRGFRVILDKDLAELYGVTTYRLNEQIKRNKERFPADFMFQLTHAELADLRSQIAISKNGRGGSRYLPNVFTEHGAVMAAKVLNSKIAVEMSILVVRAFLRLRELLKDHGDLRKRLQDIEVRLAKGFEAHEHELQEIRCIINQLEQPTITKKKRIGF